jgi:hypothetical protein
MKIKLNGKTVCVRQKLCAGRKCFVLGQTKGSFTPGRGYTSYQKKPTWICLTRDLRGCPTVGLCPGCQTGFVDGDRRCNWCGRALKPIVETQSGCQVEKTVMREMV